MQTEQPWVFKKKGCVPFRVISSFRMTCFRCSQANAYLTVSLTFLSRSWRVIVIVEGVNLRTVPSCMLSRFPFLPVKFALPLVVSPAQCTTNLLGAFSLSRVAFQTLKVEYIRRLRRHHPTQLMSNQSALISVSQVSWMQPYNTLRMRCLLALNDCNDMNY